jgi:hypothetical protein
MDYPPKFSSQARAAVEAEKIRARNKHLKAKQDWESDWPFDDAGSVQTWILSVFLVYARQAISLGTTDVWAVDKVRDQALDGLRLITIEVGYATGFDYWIEWGGSINSKIMRRFEAAPEWRQFEDELLALAESKAGGSQRDSSANPSEGVGIADVPELPSKFRNSFEAARVKAALECLADANAFPNHPQFAQFRLHEPIRIQKVFFAYCTEARNACREGSWTVTKVMQAVDAAWPLIFGSCFDRDHPSASDTKKSEVRSALWKTVTDDQRWKQHLTELAELAKRPVFESPIVGRTEAENPNAMNARFVEDSEIKPGATVKNDETDESGVIEAKDADKTQFPDRARWLKERLRERSWNKHDVARNNGPDHKTVQKILDGKRVREDRLESLASALSKSPSAKKLPAVNLLDIPSS